MDAFQQLSPSGTSPNVLSRKRLQVFVGDFPRHIEGQDTCIGLPAGNINGRGPKYLGPSGRAEVQIEDDHFK